MQESKISIEGAEKEVMVSILKTQLDTAENQLSEFVHGMKMYKKYVRLVSNQRKVVNKARKSYQEAESGFITVLN